MSPEIYTLIEVGDYSKYIQDNMNKAAAQGYRFVGIVPPQGNPFNENAQIIMELATPAPESAADAKIAELEGISIPQAVEHLLIGLTTDGSHHKQWALDQALRFLIGRKAYQEQFNSGGGTWDTGVAL